MLDVVQVSATSAAGSGLDRVVEVTATCPAGYKLTGGSGYTASDDTTQNVYQNDAQADVNAGTYRVRYEQGSTPALGSGPAWTATVTAICARTVSQ